MEDSHNGFRVVFRPGGVAIPVRRPAERRGDVGEPGSLLDIALTGGVAIEHSCGGLAGCATCHCIVRRGAESLSAPRPDELAQLKHAVGRRPESRLACQAVPDGSTDIEVEVPRPE